MTSSPDESARLRMVAARLRRPEHEKFCGKGPLAAYAAEQRVDIRPPHPPVRLGVTVDWSWNPYEDSTWQLYFYSLNWLNILAYGATETDDHAERAGWADSLHAMVTSYLRFCMASEPDPQHRGWDDHATAYRCSHLAYFYAAVLHDRLSAEERDLYLAAMARHIRMLRGFIESGRWANSNHLLFHAEGIADAWAVFGERLSEAAAAMDLAVDTLEGFINRAFAPDGTCFEHAGYYQAFLMRRVHDTLGFFAGLGRPLEAQITERLRRGAAFLWSTMPRWPVLPNYGDTQYEKRIALSLVAPFMTDEWAMPELRQWRDTNAVLEPPPLASYPDNGFHVFRARPAPHPQALYSLFLERRFRGPHGHFDGGSFMTWYGGKPFLVDSGGPFKYRDPLRFSYFQSQLGHNSVVFDRNGAALATEVVRSHRSDEVAYVVSRAKFAKAPHRWIRVFGHLSGHAVFCVDIAAPASATSPVALFHVAPEATLSSVEEDWLIDRDGITCFASFAGPEGREAAAGVASPEGFVSRVTRVDVNFEESGLVTRVLLPGQAGLSLFSFAGDRAARCHVAGASLILQILTPSGLTEHVLEDVLPPE